MIYLACPYSHPDPGVRELRFRVANKVAAKRMAAGEIVFSPISHTHPIAMEGDLPLTWDYWEEYDRAMLAACTELLVIRLDGWEESRGVQAEIEIAREFGMGVRFCDPF